MPGGVGRSVQPSCGCFPGDPPHPCTGRLSDSFHAERRHAVECRSSVLKSKVRCARTGAESLAATRAAEATAPPALGAMEGVTDDVPLTQLGGVLASAQLLRPRTASVGSYDQRSPLLSVGVFQAIMLSTADLGFR